MGTQFISALSATGMRVRNSWTEVSRSDLEAVYEKAGNTVVLVFDPPNYSVVVDKTLLDRANAAMKSRTATAVGVVAGIAITTIPGWPL